MQDYFKQEVVFKAEYPFSLKPHQKVFIFIDNIIHILITSKSSRYLKVAKDAVDLFETNISKTNKFLYERFYIFIFML